MDGGGVISSIVSVPRGACASRPVRYEVSKEELELVSRRAADDDDVVELPGFPKELWLRDDEEGPTEEGPTEDDMDDEDDEEDLDDTDLRSTDAIFLAAKTEEDLSCVEMHLYDGDSFYVHHDVTLPAFPLALEWLRLGGGAAAATQGSFAAVGTFETNVEIWNLDVLDALEPTASLGQQDTTTTKKKKKKKTKKTKKTKKPEEESSHSDAVAALSWNRLTSNALASGSADKTVRLWDLATDDEPRCAAAFAAKGRVQSVKFHPSEAAALAYGGDDKAVHVRDCRSKDAVSDLPPLSGEVECLAWNPTNPAHLVASCDDGVVACFDVRHAANGPCWTLGRPHGKAAVSSVAFNDLGLLGTASHDKTVQLFDVRPGTKPDDARLASRAMAIGKLFALAFDEGDPFLLAAGGSKATVALWETTENSNVARFQQQAEASAAPASAPA
mmetsp:Transcript_11552/g.37970  ORF Transcript_11552/g.37970 Transcript_11552/m.37970 type:complete len:444 (+) Transcript_11552:124-1455(+)|eukprot:CAMPEP_0118898782 /NCGR_PEP_ID=MMETSP1166-20130328/5622_1 /TAXON_ID=1104430 /ORGANISM="Chrysoreinhardia sp, Strain CCMP3193" /LENGTH=443 /DNA_ID=CAMNT_0006837897 /DNA_START=75 /DNA_END=1406 /DNA_ORIENTATION=-